jgi:hypothetical protein
MSDTTALIQAIAWPVVVLVALILLRPALQDVLRNLGGRVAKISFLRVSIELATVPEFKTTWEAPELGDVRQPTPAALFDTPSLPLLEELIGGKGFDYAVVDLGGGHEWLSSRLFVFAEMLPRLRGLRCFVFVESVGTKSRRLIGLTLPEAVRWRLAQRYPWLELALERAYATSGQQHYEAAKWRASAQATGQGSVAQQQLPERVEWYRPVISPAGALGVGDVQVLGQAFLQEIQVKLGEAGQVPHPSRPPSSTDPAQPVVNCQSGWVPVPGETICERGEWLDGRHIRDLLSTDLQEDAWVKDDPNASDGEQVRAILRRKGDFVAIVFEDRTFSRLVDRRLLLEEYMAHELRQ